MTLILIILFPQTKLTRPIGQLDGGKIIWQDLFWGKSLRLPLRPLLRWLYMYFILGGILDGRAGFAWCTLQAFYEYLILLKVEEIKQHS